MGFTPNIEVLCCAAEAIRGELKHVAGRAFYVWPDRPLVCQGFSYVIPKEEQIRSQLYALLREDNGSGAVELEWNTYHAVPGSRRRVERSGEIDIVRFRSDDKVDLIEVKRVWRIVGWINKRDELCRGIDTDRAKLTVARRALESRGKCCEIVGVFVASFSDSADGHMSMDQSWGAIDLGRPSSASDFDAPAEPLNIYTRFYFVPAEGGLPDA